MLTMRSAHCITVFMNSSKMSLDSLDRPYLILLQITSFRFKSYLQRCIYLCLSPFLKNIHEVREVEQ